MCMRQGGAWRRRQATLSCVSPIGHCTFQALYIYTRPQMYVHTWNLHSNSSVSSEDIVEPVGAGARLRQTPGRMRWEIKEETTILDKRATQGKTGTNIVKAQNMTATKTFPGKVMTSHLINEETLLLGGPKLTHPHGGSPQRMWAMGTIITTKFVSFAIICLSSPAEFNPPFQNCFPWICEHYPFFKWEGTKITPCSYKIFRQDLSSSSKSVFYPKWKHIYLVSPNSIKKRERIFSFQVNLNVFSLCHQRMWNFPVRCYLTDVLLSPSFTRRTVCQHLHLVTRYTPFEEVTHAPSQCPTQFIPH